MNETEFQPIRVMLVDDHAMVRRGLATFLMVFDDLELVGEAENGAEAIQRCAEIMPDVILMDMLMPGMDGASATRAIRYSTLTTFQPISSQGRSLLKPLSLVPPVQPPP